MSILVAAENLVKGMTVEVPEDIEPSGLGIVTGTVVNDQWTNVTIKLNSGRRFSKAPGDGVEVYNVPVGFHGFA